MALCVSNIPLTLILFFVWIATPLDGALFPYNSASSLEVTDDFNHEITLTTPVFLQGASYTTIYVSTSMTFYFPTGKARECFNKTRTIHQWSMNL